MQQVKGVRAVVQGDLPEEIMQRIAASVRRAVLHELADVDLGPRLRQLHPAGEPSGSGPGSGSASVSASGSGSGEDIGVLDLIPPLVPVLGIWFQPDDGPLLPDLPDVRPIET